MEPGRASKTALHVAIRRAAHQLADPPPVLDDPIALRLCLERIVGPRRGRAVELVGELALPLPSSSTTTPGPGPAAAGRAKKKGTAIADPRPTLPRVEAGRGA